MCDSGDSGDRQTADLGNFFGHSFFPKLGGLPITTIPDIPHFPPKVPVHESSDDLGRKPV